MRKHVELFGSSYPVPDGASALDVEQRKNEFYRLIGECIKEWAQVEEKLFELCAFALQSPRKQAAIVYYKCPTIDSRLTLTDELVRCVLPERTRKNGGHNHRLVIEWDKLRKAIKNLLEPRNLLAHAPVQSVERVEYKSSLATDQSFTTLASWLEIALSKAERLRGKNEERLLRSKDLKSHLESVRALSIWISVFHSRAAAQHG